MRFPGVIRVLLVAASAFGTGCHREEMPLSVTPPCQGQETASRFCARWAEGRSIMFRLPSNMRMLVPRQYVEFWVGDPNFGDAQCLIAALPIGDRLDFAFFLPDNSGYSPKNADHYLESTRKLGVCGAQG
jgi:hypothetical protein